MIRCDPSTTTTCHCTDMTYLCRYDSPESPSLFFFFFFNDTATTEIYTLSLHDALPICCYQGAAPRDRRGARPRALPARDRARDRKSTRLNSSHMSISYAVFCLKKKKKQLLQ